MKTLEYRTMDKSQWGEGPWQNEPDKVQFIDEKTGLPCLIVRNSSGALCGYVGIDKNHPLFGKNYNDTYDIVDHIEVHGGLTFSDFCQDGDECHTICHKVEEGEDDNIWWLGFDCNHGEDLAPAREVYLDKYDDRLIECFTRLREREQYRDINYVKEQCIYLAEQLCQKAIDNSPLGPELPRRN